MLKFFSLGLAALLMSFPINVWADKEAMNILVEVCSNNQQFCVDSIPNGTFGQEGQTTVYKKAGGKTDKLYEMDWFSHGIFLSDDGHYVIRLGPWPRGYEANANDLAIAFYQDGKLIKSYSTLDIAEDVKNVKVSVSHYRIFKEVEGIVGKYLSVTRIDGKKMVFDIMDGQMLSKEAVDGFERQMQLIPDKYPANGVGR